MTKSFSSRFNRTAMFYLTLFLLIAIVLTSHAALAGETATKAGPLPYEGWLTTLRDSVTGPVAYALSIIGIVISGGVLIFGGDLSGFFRTLVFLVLVMAMLVGANSMLGQFFGRNTVEAPTTTGAAPSHSPTFAFAPQVVFGRLA